MLKCCNSKTDTFKAVLISQNHCYLITLADQEVLQCLDHDKCHIVKFNNLLFNKERICLSFELLDVDLFTYMSNSEGLAVSEVRAITNQLATALHHLKPISNIHEGMKPNIMLAKKQ